MKKVVSLLLCAVMLIGLLPVSAFAAGEAYQFKIVADKTEVNPGDEVKFTVTVAGTEECDQFGLMFKFDANVFELVKGVAQASCENEDGEELVGVKTFNKNAGKEGIAVSFLESVVYSGKVGYITLKVKENAKFTDTVFSAELAVNNGTTKVSAAANTVKISMIPAETEAPTVAPTVAPTEPAGNAGYKFNIEANKTEVKPGDEVKFTVTVEGTEACDQFGLMFKFDANVFELVKGAAQASYENEDGEELVGVKTFNKNAGKEGIAVSFLESVVYSGKVGYITLKVKANANFTETTFKAELAVNNGTQKISASANDVKITMTPAATQPTETEHVHAWVDHEAKAPTCTEGGWDAYKTCACGESTKVEKPALGHTYVDFPAVEATCDAEGNKAYHECSVCGDNNKEVVPALGHTWVDHAAVAPTCTFEGNIAYQQCSVCGAAQTAGENPMPLGKFGWVLAATGEHTFEHHDAIEATCDENGHEAFDYCTTCQCFFYADPLKLTYQAGVILATGHAWVEHEAVEPTCDLPGNIAYAQCSNCGAAQTLGENPLPLSKDGWVLGPKHNIKHVEAKAATVEAEGNVEYWYCEDCGYAWLDEAQTLVTNLKSVIIPKLEPEVTEPSVEPTEPEVTEPSTEPTEPEVTEPSTEPTEPEVTEPSVEPTEPEHVHTWVEYAAVAPSCNAEGNIAYKQCSECGEAWSVEAEPKPLSKFGWILGATGEHTFEHHDAIEATCDENGHEAFDYCTTCQCFFYADPLKLTYQAGVILALGHTWVEHEAVEPTCDLPGNIAYAQCSVCGAAQTLGENPIPLSKDGWVLGPKHNIKHVEAKAATVEAEGNVEYWYCESCGYAWLDEAQTLVTNLKSVIIPKLEPEATEPEATEPEHVHTWVEYAAVEPTCDTEGNIAYKQCSECGEAWTLGATPLPLGKFGWILGATGHNWTDIAAVEPTCDMDGNIAYQQCATCGAAQTAGENPMPLGKFGWVLGATGHNWTDIAAVEPTCDMDGNIAYQQCATCGAAQTAGENPMPLGKYGWVIGATGHNWTDIAAVEPTCDTEGNIAYQQCATCGAAQTAGENPMPLGKYGWVLSATGHAWVEYAAVEPTCDTDGNIAYAQCSNCGAAQTAGENPLPLGKYGWVLAAVGHTWVEHEAVEPTCDLPGNIAYAQCSACGAAQTLGENPMPLSKDGWILGVKHSIKHVVAKAATTEAEGNVEYWYCEDCGYAWLDEAMTKVTNLKSVVTPKLETPATGDAAPVAALVALAVMSIFGLALVVTNKKKFSV